MCMLKKSSVGSESCYIVMKHKYQIKITCKFSFQTNTKNAYIIVIFM